MDLVHVSSGDSPLSTHQSVPMLAGRREIQRRPEKTMPASGFALGRSNGINHSVIDVAREFNSFLARPVSVVEFI